MLSYSLFSEHLSYKSQNPGINIRVTQTFRSLIVGSISAVGTVEIEPTTNAKGGITTAALFGYQYVYVFVNQYNHIPSPVQKLSFLSSSIQIMSTCHDIKKLQLAFREDKALINCIQISRDAFVR